MFNLLQGEFLKLRKSKAFYISIIVIIVSVIFLYGTYGLSEKITQQQVEAGVISESVWESMNVVGFAQLMFNTSGTIVVIIFIAIFVYADYAGGALKNIVGKGYARWKIFLAKYISINVAVFIMQVIMVFAVWIGMGVFAGFDWITSADYKNLLWYSLLQILLGIGCTAIVIAINQVCRNLGSGIAVSVGIFAFSDVISTLVDLVLEYFNLGVKFSDYWIYSLMGNCPIADIERDMVVRIVGSTIVWAVIAMVTGTIHFQKADVK